MIRPAHPSLPLKIDWDEVNRCLENGAYEQVSQLLQQELNQKPSSVWHQQTAILIAHSCQLCQQSHDAANWHRQNWIEAEQREDFFRTQIASLVAAYCAADNVHAPVSVAPPTSSEPGNGPANLLAHSGKIWRRILNTFGFKSAAPPESSSVFPHQDIEKSSPGAGTAKVTNPEDGGACNDSSRLVNRPPVEPERESRSAELRKSASLAKSTGEAGPFGASELYASSEKIDLYVYMLGAFRVYQKEIQVTCWQGLKGQSIFKYLLLHQSEPVSKERLMEQFWPEADLDSMRRNLHQAIYSLRQTLRKNEPDHHYILYENEHYCLNPELAVWSDVHAFEEQVVQARLCENKGDLAETIRFLESAISLYEGDLLQEDSYDDWCIGERDRLRQLSLSATAQLSRHYENEQEYAAAINLYNRMLTIETCDESAHRGLMRCYHRLHQRHMAVRQYQKCVSTLQSELSVLPSPETVSLHNEIIAT